MTNFDAPIEKGQNNEVEEIPLSVDELKKRIEILGNEVAWALHQYAGGTGGEEYQMTAHEKEGEIEKLQKKILEIEAVNAE